jgi:hypothetical protein
MSLTGYGLLSGHDLDCQDRLTEKVKKNACANQQCCHRPDQDEPFSDGSLFLVLRCDAEMGYIGTKGIVILVQHGRSLSFLKKIKKKYDMGIYF